MQVIDDQHSCIAMKYLRNKPVRELKADEFLKLHLAEKDHLLEMKITIDLETAQDKRCVGVVCPACFKFQAPLVVPQVCEEIKGGYHHDFGFF